MQDAPNLTAALATEASHWVAGVNYSLVGQGKSHENVSRQLNRLSAALTINIWEQVTKSKNERKNQITRIQVQNQKKSSLSPLNTCQSHTKYIVHHLFNVCRKLTSFTSLHHSNYNGQQ